MSLDSEDKKSMVNDRKSETELHKIAIAQGMTTLRQDAWEKVKSGTTTYKEAIRVTGNT